MIMIRRIETMLQLKRYQMAKEIRRSNPTISKGEWKKKIKARERLTVPYNRLDTFQNSEGRQHANRNQLPGLPERFFAHYSGNH